MRPRFLADLFHANQVALGPIRDRYRLDVAGERYTDVSPPEASEGPVKVIIENGSFRSG